MDNRFILAGARLLAIVWLLAATVATAATHEFRLANGMRVIVKEDHRAPVVVSQVWYQAGSMDEFNGSTGVAHLLEHMMFKGTKNVPAGEFSKRIAAAGGRENAFTGRDHTAYFQTLHKSKLPLAFKLEADRMQNLVLTPVEFGKEVRVVMEERRLRTEDKPQALVYEQLMANAYQAHPYRRPVIGWMNDLENMRVEDARAWYRRWYAPNNAVLVVVGDVEPQAVLRLAQRYFGAIRARPLSGRKPQQEPAQRGVKRVSVKAPARFPYVLMAYHAPVLRDPQQDWEPYALEVLAGVLDGNASARLPRGLVRQSRVASEVGAGYDLIGRGPGMFLLEATPSEGRSAAEVEAALRSELERIRQEGVAEEELQRVKAQVISSQVYQRDSMFYQAMQLGELALAGLPSRTLDIRLEKIKAVSSQQVQAVARKYLSDDNLTVAVLDPQPLEDGKPAAPAKEVQHGR